MAAPARIPTIKYTISYCIVKLSGHRGFLNSQPMMCGSARFGTSRFWVLLTDSLLEKRNRHSNSGQQPNSATA